MDRALLRSLPILKSTDLEFNYISKIPSQDHPGCVSLSTWEKVYTRTLLWCCLHTGMCQGQAAEETGAGGEHGQLLEPEG